MKRALLAVAAAGALATVGGCAQAFPAAPAPPAALSPASAAAAITTTTATGRVTNVVDGDTIDVQLNAGDNPVRIRVIGVDTPETVKPGYGVACYGPQASKHAHEVFDGQTVTVRTDPTQHPQDKYGRMLAYIGQPDGQDYSTAAVAAGYGRADKVGRPPQEWPQLLAAERHAQTTHTGLWGACGGGFPTPKPR